MTEIRMEQTKEPKALPPAGDPLVFGTIFTDHMLEVDYTEGKGWHDARVVPYHNLGVRYSIMDRKCLRV